MTFITADASRVTPADFIRALAPQPDPLDVLIGRLWSATPEEAANIHAQLAEHRKAKGIELPGDRLTAKVEAELRFTIEQQRAA